MYFQRSSARAAEIAKKIGDPELVVVWEQAHRRASCCTPTTWPELPVQITICNAEFDKLLTEEMAPLVHIGTSENVTILELAAINAWAVGFECHLSSTSPSGQQAPNLMDPGRVHAMDWRLKIELEDGFVPRAK